MRNFLIILISLILFTISALFFAQNDSIIIINYFSGELNWQLNWVMIFCLLTGFILGVFSVLGSLLKYKVKLKMITKKLEVYQKEIDSLRVLPIKEKY